MQTGMSNSCHTIVGTVTNTNISHQWRWLRPEAAADNAYRGRDKRQMKPVFQLPAEYCQSHAGLSFQI